MSFAKAAEYGDGDQGQIEQALRFATSTIQTYLQQRIFHDTSNVTLYPRGNVVLLPELPVHEVTSVEHDGEPVEFWLRQDAGILLLDRNVRDVDVTYTHGYETIPEDIKSVTIDLARRRLENPRAHTQRSVGDASESFSSQAVGTQLNDGDKASLDPYRRVP